MNHSKRGVLEILIMQKGQCQWLVLIVIRFTKVLICMVHPTKILVKINPEFLRTYITVKPANLHFPACLLSFSLSSIPSKVVVVKIKACQTQTPKSQTLQTNGFLSYPRVVHYNTSQSQYNSI